MFTRSDRCFVFMVHMLGYIRVLENFPRCSYDPRPTTDRGVPDMTSSKSSLTSLLETCRFARPRPLLVVAC